MSNIKVLMEKTDLLTPGTKLKVECKGGDRPGTYIGILLPERIYSHIPLDDHKLSLASITSIALAKDEERVGFYPPKSRLALMAAASAHS